MGLMDNIRGFVSKLRGTQESQTYVDDRAEKSMLANKIVSLVSSISKINSFDSSIWNLSHTSTYELQRKSVEELRSIASSLEGKFAQLNQQGQRRNTSAEALEEAKWTGQKPRGMSSHDFDRLQRSDDGLDR